MKPFYYYYGNKRGNHLHSAETYTTGHHRSVKAVGLEGEYAEKLTLSLASHNIKTWEITEISRA